MDYISYMRIIKAIKKVNDYGECICKLLSEKMF